MTAPTAGPQSTTPYTITPGAAPVRIGDGVGNTPAGLTLVNRADNGQTIWVQAGASGSGAIPLGPGASLAWTDAGTFPYAYVTGSSGKTETLVVTNQANGYANPAAVATATATQLAAQGIPSTFLDTGYGTYRLNPGSFTPALTVGQSATLVVGCSWPQPTPVGANVVQLDYTDPAVPDLPAQSFHLTTNNAISAGEQSVWQVPVLAPVVTARNLQPLDNNNAPAYVQIAGNNRPTDRFVQVGDGDTNRVMSGSLVSGASAISAGDGGSRFTRYNGQSWYTFDSSVVSDLYLSFVGRNGAIHDQKIIASAAAATHYTGVFAHPPVPCWWTVTTSAAGNCVLNVGAM